MCCGACIRVAASMSGWPRGLASLVRGKEVHSSFAPLHYPLRSLAEFLLDHIVDMPPHTAAVVDGTSDRTVTYGQLVRDIRSCAASLSELGITQGDRVAIVAPNHVDYVSALHGVALAGAVSTTVNPLSTAHEVERQLRMTSAKVIIAHPSTLRLCKQVGATIGGKVPLICFDEQQPDVLSYGSLLENRQAQPAPLDLDPRTSLCTLPFSSGTTGIPKGTMLTHFNLVANILQSLPIEGSFNRPGMAVLAPLPFFHIYGLNTCINVTLITGATLITMPKFDMEQYLAIIQKYRVERSIVVPPIVLGLAKHPLVDKYDLSSLKCLMSGAAPLGVEVQAECADRLKVIVKQGWGMTELSPVGAASPDDLQVPGAAGILVPDTIARIADPETGEVLEPREIGELQVKGPQMMIGYMDNRRATQETITSDGFLKTGDIGYFDEHGCLHIVDRCKDLIKYKGFQVAPAEIEDILGSHLSVRDCICVPVPDEEAGELPKAYVVLNTGVENINEQDIIDYVAEHVAPHKRLRGGVEFVDGVPRSASGKLLRRVMKEQAQKKVDGDKRRS